MDNTILSLSKKLQHFFFNMDTQNMLVLLLAVGGLSILLSIVNENILSAQSVIIVLITVFAAYLYFKKEFNERIRELKVKNRVLKKNTILESICKTKKHSKSKICNKYSEAKNNFHTISDLLLRQYNSK